MGVPLFAFVPADRMGDPGFAFFSADGMRLEYGINPLQDMKPSGRLSGLVRLVG